MSINSARKLIRKEQLCRTSSISSASHSLRPTLFRTKCLSNTQKSSSKGLWIVIYAHCTFTCHSCSMESSCHTKITSQRKNLSGFNLGGCPRPITWASTSQNYSTIARKSNNTLLVGWCHIWSLYTKPMGNCLISRSVSALSLRRSDTSQAANYFARNGLTYSRLLTAAACSTNLGCSSPTM
jgi:hypothetical protein